MLLHKNNTITPEEYLNLERLSEFKNEYFNGEMFAMAGASREHNQISSNIIRVLANQLLDTQCTVFASDMKIKIDAIGKYTYPDVVVVCGGGQYEDDFNDTLLNPIVIMEILSKSTEGYDRGDKFYHYQLIDSFIEYILISQNFYRVEKFVRQIDGTWIYSKYNNPQDVVKVESLKAISPIKCEITLEEIYQKVNIRSLYEL
ncbi:MAG: Uma2 family endonuclease [Desulfamplus sp.]|nr:Uma2 family endonuclease [Desulfamplus sp.]MBF0388884.1 Uma2 family endonuclease [Desulfamplus sp.]